MTLSTYSSNDDLDYELRKALTTGVAFEYYLSSEWSIRSGVFYRQSGAIKSNDVIEKLNYLSAPVNASWHFGRENNWHLNFGLQINRLLSATTKLDDNTEFDAIEEFEPWDLGLNAGIGYKFFISDNSEIFAELQGYNGFTNVVSDERSSSEFYNISSTLSTGIIFYL